MDVSKMAEKVETPGQARSWGNRLRSVTRPVLLCDLLVVGLLAVWAGSRIDLIVNRGLVGGCGDESHRLVIAERLCYDFWGNIYSHFFERPWPPMPYIVQSAAFRLQQGLGLSAGFGTAAVCSATSAYTLAALLAYIAMTLRFQRVAGVVCVVLMLSLHELTSLALTVMAESYCTFFLQCAFLLAALPGAPRRRAVFIGLALMAANQCRSEVIVLSVPFAVYCFYKQGRFAAAACFVLTVFPFLLKTVVNFVTNFTGMSYFNLANGYHFEKTWYGNLMNAVNAFQYYCHLERASGALIGFLLLAALCAGLARAVLAVRIGGDKPAFQWSYFLLLVGAAGTLSAGVLMAMAALVLPFARYFVVCHTLWILPFSVAVSLPIASLGPLLSKRKGLGWPLRDIRQPWLRGAVALPCLLALTGSLFRSAECFRATSVALYEEQSTRIPQSLLSAKQWLRENYKQGHVCFDSVAWWETLLFYHSMRHDSQSTQFMVYDRPPGDWQEGLCAKAGEGYIAATHRYVEAFRPEFIVLAGPEYRRLLENTKLFYDFNERPSYLRPFLSEREDGTLHMSESPYWKDQRSLSVTLSPAYQNEAVAIYRAEYRVTR